MSESFVVKVEGLRDLQAALKRVAPELAKQLRSETRKTLAPVITEAKSLAPERSGTLKRKIRIESLRFGTALAARAPYAPIIEFGKKRKSKGGEQTLTPKPFMLPAAHHQQERIRRDLEQLVTHTVDRYLRRV